ncbi:hypothetical protein GCM10027321_21450 [Massilia terrae]
MQDAGAGRHPLDVPGADHAAIAGRILVLDLALIHDGHGLEAAVRVLADAAAAGRGLEIVRTGIVEQQEGADMLAQVVVRTGKPSPTQWLRLLP